VGLYHHPDDEGDHAVYFGEPADSGYVLISGDDRNYGLTGQTGTSWTKSNNAIDNTYRLYCVEQ